MISKDFDNGIAQAKYFWRNQAFMLQKIFFYRVCNGFRSTKRFAYFRIDFDLFKPSIVFGGSWGSTENWLEPKTKPPSGNLACPNL